MGTAGSSFVVGLNDGFNADIVEDGDGFVVFCDVEKLVKEFGVEAAEKATGL